MALTIETTDGSYTAIYVTGDGAVTGASARPGRFNDRTVTCSGTFASAVITVEGSNNGSTWQTLHAIDGTPATFSTTGIAVLLEATRYIRVSSASGSGATVTTTIHCTGGY